MITDVLRALIWLLNAYQWVVIASGLFLTLASFGVLDTRNRVVWSIGDFLYRATEPALRPIRRVLPNTGGIDFSFLVLLVLIWLVQQLLGRLAVAIALGSAQPLFF